MYLYWQWWHYTRQSEGISKANVGKSRDKHLPDPRLARAALYSVPLAGILAVSHRSPPEFLYFPLRTLPATETVVLVATIVTMAILGLWVLEQVKAYMAGRLAIPYVMYVTSHFMIYFFAYLYIEEINYGWLIINIWHNAQYIFFARVLSDALSTTFAMTATMTGLIIYQTINFHHYIVDSLIWKLRKIPMLATLSLS